MKAEFVVPVNGNMKYYWVNSCCKLGYTQFKCLKMENFDSAYNDKQNIWSKSELDL